VPRSADAEDRLDAAVAGEGAKRVLELSYLGEMLEDYLKAAAERGDQSKEKLSKLRHAQRDAEAGIIRLLEFVEESIMEAEDSAMRERLIELRKLTMDKTKTP